MLFYFFTQVIFEFQFRDFLQLYNKLTELCFQHCADNFYTRDLSNEESTCLDKCVLKFSNVNQRIMNAYVHDQSLINERRMKEVEEQMKTANLNANASNTPALASEANSTLVTDSTTVTSSLENQPQPVPT